MRVAVLLCQVIGRLRVVHVLKIVDEPCEAQPDIFLQQPFADTLCLSRTGPSIDQEIGIIVIEFQMAVWNPGNDGQPDRGLVLFPS